jgi:hypothetical protein
MKKIILFFALFIPVLSLILLSSCKKSSKCVGGSRGNVTVITYLKHHGRTIPNQAGHPDTVFVKYNTQNSPGSNPSSYDAYFVGGVGEDHIHVTGLQCGDYYFYGVGKDTTLDTIASPHVSGGSPFSFDQTSGEITFSIPVTE